MKEEGEKKRGENFLRPSLLTPHVLLSPSFPPSIRLFQSLFFVPRSSIFSIDILNSTNTHRVGRRDTIKAEKEATDQGRYTQRVKCIQDACIKEESDSTAGARSRRRQASEKRKTQIE
mmetsp:Transcript_14362/g.28890  ORF Transcript_14362/g.28890 Transcript_14362/m.28890 type:complete len:118 (-) Transcript_14362:678-1031(-)